MKYIKIVLLLLSFNGFACELTAEYKEARIEGRKEIYAAYKSCTASVGSYFYYKAVTKCIEEERGKDVGGGCFHIASYEQRNSNKDSKHCKVLKPTTDQIIEYVSSIVAEREIEKCLH